MSPIYIGYEKNEKSYTEKTSLIIFYKESIQKYNQR